MSKLFFRSTVVINEPLVDFSCRPTIRATENDGSFHAATGKARSALTPIPLVRPDGECCVLSKSYGKPSKFLLTKLVVDTFAYHILSLIRIRD